MDDYVDDLIAQLHARYRDMVADRIRQRCHVSEPEVQRLTNEVFINAGRYLRNPNRDPIEDEDYERWLLRVADLVAGRNCS